MIDQKPQRLLTAHEVADRLGKIHPKTVLVLADRGDIPKPIKAKYGKGKVWRESDIDEHIAKQELES